MFDLFGSLRLYLTLTIKTVYQIYFNCPDMKNWLCINTICIYFREKWPSVTICCWILAPFCWSKCYQMVWCSFVKSNIYIIFIAALMCVCLVFGVYVRLSKILKTCWWNCCACIRILCFYTFTACKSGLLHLMHVRQYSNAFCEYTTGYRIRCPTIAIVKLWRIVSIMPHQYRYFHEVLYDMLFHLYN